MEANTSRPNLKRPLSDEDEGSNKPPDKKRVRFPKGKKVKHAVVEDVVEVGRKENEPVDLTDPRAAAKERAKRRSQITTELGINNDVSAAEVAYDDNESFVDDGIQIEPFNLDKEREEGYFDADGNFVEYVNENEIKDAWLDSVEVETKYAGKASVVTTNDDDVQDQDLSSDAIGKIKRRIADVLEPGETVLQALRRLKGASSNRKEKMSSETKAVFDQLTEDTMKLMENGEYDVYHEKQEVFQREAEGYENLARLRSGGPSTSSDQGYLESNPEDIFSGANDTGIVSSASDAFDMFAEDDENAIAKPSSVEENLVSGPSYDGGNQPLPNISNTGSESGDVQNDYVYDESSGYYYSSSLGYYYDPSTGLYCSATSGQWYAYNEETGTYNEVQAAES